MNIDIGGSGQAVVNALLGRNADERWGGPARVMHELNAHRALPLRCFCSLVK